MKSESHSFLTTMILKYKAMKFRNFIWNILGSIIPLFAALVAVPILIKGLGLEKFGLLSLCWIIVGYFGLFDLGIGRALTQLIARARSNGENEQISAIVWSALWLMLAVGNIIGLILWLSADTIASNYLGISQAQYAEAAATLTLLAYSIPLVVLTAALRGILEAYEAFATTNSIRIPLGVASYIGPVVALQYTTWLPFVVATIVMARILAFVAHFAVCAARFQYMRRLAPLDREKVGELLSFGGWLTLSNIVGPLLLYVGRFAIAAMLSVTAVAIFSTPYDLIVNFLVIPAAIAGVVFPQLSSSFSKDVFAVKERYKEGKILIFCLMLPVLIVCVIGAQPFIAWWIDPSFAEQSYRVAQILAVGVFINSFGHLSQAVIQASGRPDITAKLHVAELILYIPYMYFLIVEYGVLGAALAWSIRTLISTFALALLANMCISKAAPIIDKRNLDA